MQNVFMLDKHSQIKELGSEIKLSIVSELMLNAATCQQLADILGISKQKTHYNLKSLLEQGLITTEPELSNNKEVYYRAKAKNYIIDFSLGKNATNGPFNSREVLNSILQENYGINLDYIAEKLITDCLKLKPRERLLVTTGRYNMPLVEKILTEAGKRQIETTLIYQHREFIEAKNQEFSLSALIKDYDHFNQLLQRHDVYLNLNGEARFVPMPDPERQAIRSRGFAKSREIIKKNKIRVAIMPGLMKTSLKESDIISEINFWKALDIDYARLRQATEAVSQKLLQHKSITISSNGASLSFEIDKVVCEYGSFGDSEKQSPIINLPGGKVLIIPKPGSVQGSITAQSGFAYGETIGQPHIAIKNNKIVTYQAQNQELLQRAIAEGGPDGGTVSLFCFNTNYNVGMGAIDTSLQQKAPGFLTAYWGENVSFGGTVQGQTEWSIRFDSPEITLN